MSHHNLFCLILALSMIWSVKASGGGPNPDRLAEVDSLIGIGDAEAAMSLLVIMVDKNDLPDELNWPVYQRLGFVSEALGDDQRALDFLEKAAIWGPNIAMNHRNLGTLLMKMGRTGRALSEIREASELDPDDWELHLEYSQVLDVMGQTPAARRELEAAGSLCPDCPQVHKAWARFYLGLRDYEGAEPHLAELYRLDPDPEIRKQLALARLRMGDPETSRILLLQDWPGGLDQEGIRIILEADLALGESTRAAALISEPGSFTTSVDDPDLWALASLVCLETGRNTEALQMIDLAIALSPSVAGYHNNRYILLTRLGREREASRDWKILLDLDPQRASAERETVEQAP